MVSLLRMRSCSMLEGAAEPEARGLGDLLGENDDFRTNLAEPGRPEELASELAAASPEGRRRVRESSKDTDGFLAATRSCSACEGVAQQDRRQEKR